MKSNRAWFTYILRCADGTLYTGITTDTERRLIEHNKPGVGAKYTRARQPVTLVYFEKYTSRVEASRREAEIKKLSRVQKLSLIEG
jgi:putative endonuclease